ncbi:putative Actin-binding FH2 protein [Pseudoloma neurophilia]|uniref:Putative Actin-binding FH2 protein n=1 Tax=Pseudoloma neurophilia TaxID=146866 RepID=A0A0R0LWD4_9MICR|nr:putative Actin-binding FH2 protein [Pseudoloma neurophilia]
MTEMGSNNIQNKISIFERIASLNLRHNTIRETEICPRIILINSSSYEKTFKYLKNKQNFLFLNFDEQKEVFRNEIRFDDKLSLEECIAFCKILEFWLNQSEISQIIVRCSKKELLDSYIFCYNHFLKDKNNISDLENILKQNTTFLKSNFFEFLTDFYNGKEFKSLNLHQIVITTIPKKRNDTEKPFLKPFYSLRIIEKPMIPNVQYDENYVICKVGVALRSDITLEFYRNSTKLFTIFLNTISFDEGLYRFTEKDCFIEDGTILSEDFTVDVVFFSTTERPKFINFDSKAQIADRLVGTYNRKIYESYKTAGQKHEDSIISALLEKNAENIDHLGQESISSPQSQKEEELNNFIRPYEPDDTIELIDVPLIADVLPERVTENRSIRRKMAPTRKKTQVIEKKEESVVVRPFYWATIPKSCDSIFNELQNVKTFIDCTKFEEWFSVTTESQDIRIEKQKGSVIKDSRRLFLLSIALKTFEKRELTLDVVSLNKMALEDLIIIDRMIPTDSEFTLLSTDLSNCNEIELQMVKFYKYKNLVKILVFERKFFEIKDQWMYSIENIKNGFDEILNSNNIRVLLKIVLELGNLINTNYGNNRKTASAFKLTSLLLTKQYRGNTKNQSLLRFIADSAKSRLRNFDREIEDLEMLKKEDLLSYKESINEYIIEYRDLKTILPELDHDSRAAMKSFFLYFSEYIAGFKNLYKEAVVYSSIIKRKFGETEEKDVKEIINCLYDFMTLIKGELVD